MSIASRITAIEEHIRDVYDTIDYSYDTTDVDKNIINIPQNIFNGYINVLNDNGQSLWNNLTKVSQADVEEAELSNVVTAPMKISLQGNTSQDTTSGKNLQIPLSSSITMNGVTFTPIFEDGMLQYVNVNGTSTSVVYVDFPDINFSAGTYIMTGSPSGGSDSNYQQRFVTGTSNLGTDNGNGVSVTLNEATNCHVRIRIASGYAANNLKFYPMVRLSSIADDTYEPYTGGIPSPNPDYPQQVKVVKGENVVSVSGKNLINKNGTQAILAGAELSILDTGIRATITTAGTFKYGGLLILNSDKLLGKTITLSASIEKSGNNIPAIYLYELTSDNQLVKNVAGISFSTQSRSFTLPTTYSTYDGKTASKFGLLIYGNTNGTGNIGDYVDYKDLMLELGSTRTPYVPYSKTDYPISLGTIEKCKIGNYKDFFFEAKNGDEYYDTLTAEQKNALNYGSWYLHKAIGKKVFNGSETWVAGSTQTTGYSRFANSDLQGKILPPSSNDEPVLALSDKFEIISSNSTYRRHNGIDCRTTGSYIDVYYDQLAEGTAEDFKTWLSNNNVTLYYVLATPTEEEITNTTLIEQLEAIYKAKSVKDKTYITQTNDELPFILDVEAIKEYSVE